MLIKTNYFEVLNMKKIFLLPPQGNANWFQCISTFQGDYNYVPMKKIWKDELSQNQNFYCQLIYIYREIEIIFP